MPGRFVRRSYRRSGAAVPSRNSRTPTAVNRAVAVTASSELTRFAREERERLSGNPEEAEARVSPLGHPLRLLSLLRRALDEFDAARLAFMADVEVAETATGESEEELFERGARLAGIVHLRVEAFYGLARLLLDRTAQAVEHYLGSVADLPLATHRRLEEHLAAFAERKRLTSPLHVVETARELSAEVLDDTRDLVVELGDRPRPMVAIVWAGSGDAGIVDSRTTEPIALRDVLGRLDDYVGGVVRYLDENRTARLKGE